MRLLFCSFCLALLALAGCSGGGAPITDGSYVTYEIGDTRVRITFEDAGSGKYRTVGVVTEDDGSQESAVGMPGHDEKVNSKLYTESGVPLEVASFGPIWASPSSLKEGKRVYGSPVSAVRQEHGRSVASIEASFGVGGALRGEWLYDVTTGFAVGGSKSSPFLGEGGGFKFRLVETNIPGLVVS